jgi:hypothetical protein
VNIWRVGLYLVVVSHVNRRIRIVRYERRRLSLLIRWCCGIASSIEVERPIRGHQRTALKELEVLASEYSYSYLFESKIAIEM